MPLQAETTRLLAKVARVGEVKDVAQQHVPDLVTTMALKVWCAEAVRAGMLCHASGRGGYQQLVRRVAVPPLDYFTPFLLRYLAAHPSTSPVAAVVARATTGGARLDASDSAAVDMAQAHKYDISHMKALEDHMEGRVARDLGTYALVRKGTAVAMWTLADVGTAAVRADGIVVMSVEGLTNKRLYGAVCTWLLWWSRTRGRAVLYDEEHLYDDVLRDTLRAHDLLPLTP